MDFCEVKRIAFESCKSYLGGVWDSVELNDFDVRRISGGLSNYLYLCSIVGDCKAVGEEQPLQVMLRIYGDNHDKNISLEKDLVVTALISYSGFGPKLYGILPMGRIEQFIPSTQLSVTDLYDPRISENVARAISRFHSLEMPFIKRPKWFFETIEKNLSVIENHNIYNENADLEKVKQLQSSYNFRNEYEFVRNLLESLHSPVVFCHNDFQPTNILKLANSDCEVVLIDYEYANYNYRGFDIGNIFCEWMMVNDYNEYPYFKCNPSAYPTPEQQLHFIRAYLLQNKKSESEEKLLVEANHWALICHFFWSLWCACQVPSPNVPFAYLDYALARMKVYTRHKEQLLDGVITPNFA